MMVQDMAKERLQILISAVNKDPESLAVVMGLESDAVIVNQLIGDGAQSGISVGEKSYEFHGHQIHTVTMRDKGVGLSRNTALSHADA